MPTLDFDKFIDHDANFYQTVSHLYKPKRRIPYFDDIAHIPSIRMAFCYLLIAIHSSDTDLAQRILKYFSFVGGQYIFPENMKSHPHTTKLIIRGGYKVIYIIHIIK